MTRTENFREHEYTALKSKPRELSRLITELEPRSNAAEAFRILKTNLNFKNVDGNLKYIAVTSAISREGKTTTAANLAIALAQGGNRIILVDADLRIPTLHKIFGFNAFEGLTNCLVEGMDPLRMAKDFTDANIKVLTAGPLPPNPSELLGSKRMKITLERLGSAADFVIVDCPPTLGLNDSLALSPYIDGFLLVIGSGRSTKGQIVRAKEQLNLVGANVFGVVVNGFQHKDTNYNYNY